jgi:hypothetical protein
MAWKNEFKVGVSFERPPASDRPAFPDDENARVGHAWFRGPSKRRDVRITSDQRIARPAQLAMDAAGRGDEGDSAMRKLIAVILLIAATDQFAVDGRYRQMAWEAAMHYGDHVNREVQIWISKLAL